MSILSNFHYMQYGIINYRHYAVIRFPRIYSFHNWKFVLLKSLNFPLPSAPGNHCSTLCYYEFDFLFFLDSTYKWDHIVFVFFFLCGLFLLSF